MEAGDFMTRQHAFITRTEKSCPQCGQRFVAVGPTDAKADGTTEVDLVCPSCHFPGRATLSDTRRLQSVFPSPDAVNPLGVALDASGWITQKALAAPASFRRPTELPT